MRRRLRRAGGFARAQGQGLLPNSTISITGSSGGDAYAAHPVELDGMNDYLTRDAALDGAADSKRWTVSLWFRRNGGTGAVRRLMGSFQGTTNNLVTGAYFIGTNNIEILGLNATGNSRLSLNTDAAFTDSNWHHIMWSCDLTDAAKCFVYVDGVADAFTVFTYVDDNLGFSTAGDYVVGGRPDGGHLFTGDIADLQTWQDAYIDLSVQANRELFILAGAPVDPAVAAASSLGTPIVALTAQTTAAWHINNGSGGGLTEHGALTDGTGPVQL